MRAAANQLRNLWPGGCCKTDVYTAMLGPMALPSAARTLLISVLTTSGPAPDGLLGTWLSLLPLAQRLGVGAGNATVNPETVPFVTSPERVPSKRRSLMTLNVCVPFF